MSLKQMTIDNLIEITEGLALTVADINKRLDAMEQPPKVAWVASVDPSHKWVDDIERAATIKALRWVHCDTMRVRTLIEIVQAITRLENGGDL
jgi:hypothetical protein